MTPAPGKVVRDEAFSRFVLPEIDVLLRVATSITGDPVDAEDLVQDTLIRAYRAVDRFDGRHPRAWLLTILRNTQRNRVRRRRPGLLREPDAAMERLEAQPSAEDHPEGAVEATFDQAVEAAFASLPPKARRIVELVDLDGLSYQEAAEVLDVPVGTVMSRLHRARKRIRRHLEAAGVNGRMRQA